MKRFHPTPDQQAQRRTRQVLAQSQAAVLPHTPYACEKQVLAAVQAGDQKQAQAAFRQMRSAGRAGFLPGDSLQQARILFIAFITLITRAAMEGGLPEELAYAKSDAYLQLMEGCAGSGALQALQEQALEDFTAAVAQAHPRAPASRPIRRAIRFFRRHLGEPLTLEQAAAVSGLSPSRFSHLFREETGESPMAYLRRLRLENACLLLADTDEPISRIGEILGFGSPSQFCQSFRLHTGMSPSQYRKATGRCEGLPGSPGI